MKDLFGELDELGAQMRACLAVLDGGSPEDDGVLETFTVATRAFAELGDLSHLGRDLPADQHTQVRRALEELVRLNALLTVAVARDKERLMERVVQARKARKMVESRRTAQATGMSCDMRG